MTSTFKLTNAEFRKIFKRPSIFIMALFLVATIFVSMFIFDPQERVSYTVEYADATSSEMYYANFFSEGKIDSKSDFDLKINSTNEAIAYYTTLNEHNKKLTELYSNIVSTMEKMMNETNMTIKSNLRDELTNYVTEFREVYANFEILKDYPSLTTATLKTFDFKDFKDPQNYYLYNDNAGAPLNTFYNYCIDKEKYSASEIENYYNTNGYEQKLKNVLDCGNNFIFTTIKGMSELYNQAFVYYDQYTNKGVVSLSYSQSYRKLLLDILQTTKDYTEQVYSSPYPLVLIRKDDKITFEEKINEAITFLDISVSDDSKLDKHKEIIANLNENRIGTFLSEFATTNRIIQAKINEGTITEYDKIKQKVIENENKILEDISTHRTDESITNIQKDISNYKLLSIAYTDIINDKIRMYITDGYDYSVYSKFYGYDFDTFNKFQATENINKLQYSLNNNTYSNSYLNNFSFNQMSGTTTNVYDFMYFAMELCTLIIIIFAMMMVCSLITGETESGTIKLLLVRPYKRSKIITAKLLATIFFVLTFMLFSAVLTFAGGYFVYGYTSLPVLAVFNGTSVFEISPLLLMFLNVIFLSFDVIFFVFLSLMISIICKNYAGSISCALVVLIVNFAMNIIFSNMLFYSFLPGINLHLFKYFGNAFMTTTSGSIAGLLQSFLITPIQSSMTFWYSVIINSIYSFLFLTISYSVFQKRDF